MALYTLKHPPGTVMLRDCSYSEGRPDANGLSLLTANHGDRAVVGVLIPGRLRMLELEDREAAHAQAITALKDEIASYQREVQRWSDKVEAQDAQIAALQEQLEQSYRVMDVTGGVKLFGAVELGEARAQIAALQAENIELKGQVVMFGNPPQSAIDRYEQAEAQLRTVQAERDKWLDAFNRSEQFQSGPTTRAEKAEAQLRTVGQALRELRGVYWQETDWKLRQELNAILAILEERT